MRNGIPILDGHVHYAAPIPGEQLDRILEREGADGCCIAALPHPACPTATTDALLYKAERADRAFVLGGLDPAAYYAPRGEMGERLVRRVRELLDAGCDGVKMIEGKPDARRRWPIPDFDDVAWEPYFCFLEGTQTPLLWHVNDPETFWDPARVTAVALAHGWAYGPDDVNNEAQYRQVEAVLIRHPRLKVTFAHGFFLSAQLLRLRSLMERFCNMHIDLAPGVELYQNLSQTPEETQRFFEDFGTRIFYGTDSGGRAVIRPGFTEINERECAQRASLCQRFLFESGETAVEPDPDYLVGQAPFSMRCLGLDPAALRRILHDNFCAFAGETPRPVDRDRARRLPPVLHSYKEGSL